MPSKDFAEGVELENIERLTADLVNIKGKMVAPLTTDFCEKECFIANPPFSAPNFYQIFSQIR